MLESFLFIVLLIFLVIIAIVFLVIGLLSKNEKLTKIGIYSFFGAPIFIVLLYIFWYSVVIPRANKSQMKEYSGMYKSEKGNFIIELKSDGNYISDSIPKLRIHKKGKWKTGGIDGMFELYDNKGVLKAHVGNGYYPDGTQVLTFPFEEIKFLKIKNN